MALKKKQKLKRSHSLEPQNIDNETWFYDDPRGLRVVRRTITAERIITEQFVIPWRMVIAAVERHALKPRT